MTSNRDRRIVKELKELQADSAASGVLAWPPNEGNLRALVGSFPGPPDSPYQGGTFEVDIAIPENYPFQPPKMKLMTTVWHPNVSSQTGAICLDTLTTGWSPVQTLRSALMSLQSLFADPNPKDPQDAEVAKMMMEHPAMFEQKAHDWAVKHAGAPRRSLDASQHNEKEAVNDPLAKYSGYNKEAIDSFGDMGFGVEETVKAFQEMRVPPQDGRAMRLNEMVVSTVIAQILSQRN